MPGLLHVYALLWPAIALRCCVLAQWAPNVAPENRSLDQIYAAAQLEQCRLTVSAGGDGESTI